MTSDGPWVGYRTAGAADPGDGHGLFDLTVHADGAVSLSHRHRGVERTWAARADAAVWRRLVDALRGEIAEGEPADPVRELVVSGIEAIETGPGPGALRILDSLVHQVSGGVLPGGGTLPLIVHGVVETDRVGPAPQPAGAVGVLDPRRVAGVVRVDGAVSVVGVPVGTPVTELPPTGSPPRTVAFGDLGRTHRPQPVIMTGSDDGLIRLWTPQGTPMARQVRHNAPIAAVTTSIDNQQLQVWSADLSGKMLQRCLIPGVMVLGWPPVPGPPAGITALGWAGTASYQVLVMGLDDGRVVRRAVRAPDDVAMWNSHDGPVHAITLIGVDDDFLIASAGADGVIRVRAGLAGTAWPDLPGHDATVTGLSFGLIGERLLLGSCSLDGTARTWDVHTREPLASWSVGDWPAGIADARTGADQRWATGGADGVVRVWDAATGERVHELRPDGVDAAVMCLTTALLPGVTLVAAGYGDGSFCVWNAGDGSLVGIDRSSAEPLTSIEFGRDGQVVAFLCGTLAGAVRVYDPATCELVKVLTPHTDRVLTMAFGRTGRGGDPVIVSGGADRAVRIWAGRTGWPLHHLDGHTDEVTVVAVGEVGGRTVVASGGYDRTLRLWDAGSGTALGRLTVATSAVHALAFGTAGGEPVIAVGGRNEAVRVVGAATGDLVLTTDEVPGQVTGIAVGAWQGADVVAATVGDDVRCWRLPTGEPLPAAGPPWRPLAVTFGAGGELLAVGTGGVAVIDPPRPDERG